jgi:uncharacterized protein (DUF427 family)
MVKRIVPQAGQESVWDYPRPPRVEVVSQRLRVIFNGQVIADTTAGLRVLETSHPPSYYFPPAAVQMDYLSALSHTTFCEFKGIASYWTVRVGDRTAQNAVWGYLQPAVGYEALKGYFSFYANHMEACYVGDERVQPQAGDFYGGWITSNIVGPFKGAPGTWGW